MEKAPVFLCLPEHFAGSGTQERTERQIVFDSQKSMSNAATTLVHAGHYHQLQASSVHSVSMVDGRCRRKVERKESPSAKGGTDLGALWGRVLLRHKLSA